MLKNADGNYGVEALVSIGDRNRIGNIASLIGVVLILKASAYIGDLTKAISASDVP